MKGDLPQAPTRARAATILDIAAAVLAGLLFLIASVRFGGPVAGDELDPSWTMVLRWASLHGLHWGSDIAFTYGPLGYLSPWNACDPGTYGRFVAAQIALAAAAAFLFANAWLAQRSPERLMLIAAVVYAAPLLAADPVWLSMPVFALVGLHAHATAERRGALWLLVVVAALYLATILLIKMSGLLLITACWLAGGVVLLYTRQRPHALAWLVLVPAATLTLWFASGQRFGDLPTFIATVLEMSRGYTAAMSSPPPLGYDVYGLGILGSSAIAGLWAAWRVRRDPARLACIALCGFALFIAWRAGFTRADTHVLIFALTAWLVLPLLAWMTPAPARWLRTVCLLLALAALPIADRTFNPGPGHRYGDLVRASPSQLRSNIGLLARPLTHRPALMAALDRERLRLDLPQIRAAVGRRRVDLAGTQQGVVIMNGLAYRPAHIFQGYGAYTPRLQQLNAAAYSGPERTDFVMLAFSPIDGNLPSSENALAFTTLYQNYDPVLVEKSYLLLEKRSTSIAPPLPAQSGWQVAGWNSWIDLPASAQSVTILALRSELSPAGKVFATALREPLQYIELELDDGTTRRFRLGRGAAPGGFLASPLLQSLDDYVRLFSGAELPTVRRFRLLPQSDRLRPLFADAIEWSATALPRRPQAELPPAMVDALYPGFSHRPVATSNNVHSMELEKRRVMFMHSPAQLRFAPGAGRYLVSGEIGIVPNAFTAAGCTRGDGVELKVSGAAATALTYPYNPFADSALRPMGRFELGPVDTDSDGVLQLAIGPGPANNGDCDWTYLGEVRLRRADSAPAIPAESSQRP